MASDRHGGYPLTTTSRRRRRLALLNEAENERLSNNLVDDPLVLRPPAAGQRVPPPPAHADDAFVRDERITRVLAARDPQTWLIAGESFLHPADSTRDWAGWIDRFTTLLRGPLRRRADTVIDACCADSTVREIRARLGMRPFETRADAVLLMCGPADAQAGIAGLSRFEEDLAAVVRHFRACGAAVVLCTSPVPCCDPGENHDICHDVYCEAVRAGALERDLPLVDHRRMWEQAAIPPGRPGSWFDGTPDRAGPLGHAALARLLFQTLCASRPDYSSMESTQSREDAEIRQGSQ